MKETKKNYSTIEVPDECIPSNCENIEETITEALDKFLTLHEDNS